MAQSIRMVVAIQTSILLALPSLFWAISIQTAVVVRVLQIALIAQIPPRVAIGVMVKMD